MTDWQGDYQRHVFIAYLLNFAEVVQGKGCGFLCCGSVVTCRYSNYAYQQDSSDVTITIFHPLSESLIVTLHAPFLR